jgi:hypothetical protein
MVRVGGDSLLAPVFFPIDPAFHVIWLAEWDGAENVNWFGSLGVRGCAFLGGLWLFSLIFWSGGGCQWDRIGIIGNFFRLFALHNAWFSEQSGRIVRMLTGLVPRERCRQ